MEYIEMIIKVNKEDLSRIEAKLIDNGFPAMMVDDPDDVRDILANPDIYRYDYLDDALMEDLGRRPRITIYFTDDEDGRSERERAEKILKSLSESPEGAELEIVNHYAGDDSEWLYKWQEHFKPSKVGKRIIVKPRWEDYKPAEGELVIEMDPGMAFGSGLHETTSMCIRALEEILTDRSNISCAEKGNRIRILDVGTGTGILAIAGVLLGADEALGVDIDSDAVRVAEENISHNGLTEKITVRYGDLTEGVEYRAEIIVANLMADLVARLSPAAAAHLAAGGWYITSGILDIRGEAVSRAIRAAGFDIVKILRDGEWRAVVARKK